MTDQRPMHPKPLANASAKPQPATQPQEPMEPNSAAEAVSDAASTADGPEPLRLDHFLKLSALSESGGQAKAFIQSGEVKVNGEVETRRRRKLKVGDVVEVDGRQYPVTEIPSAK